MQSDWKIFLSLRFIYTQHFSTWKCARVCTSTGISTNKSISSKTSVPRSACGTLGRGRESPSQFRCGELTAGRAQLWLWGSHQPDQGHKPASTGPSHAVTRGTAAPPPKGGAMGTALPVLSTWLRLSWDCCPPTAHAFPPRKPTQRALSPWRRSQFH